MVALFVFFNDTTSTKIYTYLHSPSLPDALPSFTFARIYSGKLEKGTYLNSVKDKKEKIGRMLLMHATSREDIDEAYAGDIVALAGLKENTTGDTLCATSAPTLLERMDFPDPVHRSEETRGGKDGGNRCGN